MIKVIIFNLNSLVLNAQLENICPAVRVIQEIISTNIAQTGRPILDVTFLEIDNVCIVTIVRIYVKMWPEPSRFP